MHKVKNGNEGRKRNPINAIGLALLVLFIIVTTSSISYGQTFVTKWGTDVTSAGHFRFPTAVAIDSSGYIYVTDYSNHRIQKFNSGLVFQKLWGAGSLPNFIAADSSGNIYVTDFDGGASYVYKFDTDGTLLKQWGGYGSGDGKFASPGGVATDSLGNIYVADTFNNRIQKFDSNGGFIKKWGGYGAGDGQFVFPVGIAIDSNNQVYVGDSGNCRIQKFDLDGNFLIQWGGPGMPDGKFGSISGVAVYSSGSNTYVYVADSGNQRIQKFDSNGTFLLKWGSRGIGDGNFAGPGGIAADASGNIYVADQYNLRIQKFNSSGNFVTKWGSDASGDGHFDMATGIAIDSSGNIYVADQYNFRIQKFTSSGTFSGKWGTFGFGNGEFRGPWGVAADSSGNIYVTDPVNECIQKFNSDGNFIAKFGSYGFGDGQLHVPQGVAADSAGDIYVADSLNNRIQKFNSSGNFVTKWGSNGTLDGQFQSPSAVAVDSSGNIYVADTWNNRIQKFNSSGNFVTKWGNHGTENGQFDGPMGIAVDSHGNVYVADTYNWRFQVFDSVGNFITKLGSLGYGDGQFNLSHGIATDSSGNIYTTDWYNYRVQKFTSFTIPTYTINASAGAGGSIFPSGDLIVNGGSNQTFTFTPDKWFMVQDIIVDGVPQGGTPPLPLSYQFPAVSSDHTISVSFALSTTPNPAVGSGLTSTTGPLIKVTFTYNGPAAYLVPPDCNNVVFVTDPPVPQYCRRRPPYVLTVLEDPSTPSLGSPGGDWIAANAGDSWTINCNPLEIFDEASLKANSVTITPMYTFFETDRGLDANGNCTLGAPGDICVDTSEYTLFQGTIVADPVTLTQAETQSFKTVSIDIRPLSHRNIINIQSCGYVPVAIFSASDFDTRKIDIGTVKMGDAGVKTVVVGKKSIPLTLDLDVNRDGLKDKVVFFNIKALNLAKYTGQVCLTGETTGGISFIGCDSVTIVSEKSWNRLCGCEDED